MASMSRDVRALSYVKRLREAKDLNAEALRIKNEINGLVWSETQVPLPQAEKIALLEETKRLVRSGKKTDKGEIIVEAGDNSGIIDVIDSIEKEIKKGGQ